MTKRKQKMIEKNTVSNELEATIRGQSLVINGLYCPDLNKGDLVILTLGDITGNFIVNCKELISKRVQLEEFGYWSSKIGRNEEKTNSCDFSNIQYEKITDDEKIKSLNIFSRYC